MGGAFSTVAGLLDRVYYCFRFIGNRPRFFADGWGDLAKIESLYEEKFKDLASGAKVRVPEVLWDESRVESEADLCAGSFVSPQHSNLPNESKLCKFKMVVPAGCPRPWHSGTTCMAASPSGVVVLLPATGEQGSAGRLSMARELANKNGLCCVIITAPFYGSRKPANQALHYIRSLEKYLIQSAAIIEEATMLLAWCAERWPGVPLCLSGFSWGGAMASVAALFASQRLPLASVLAVPYAGSATPAVIVDGLLQDDISWNALAADQSEPVAKTRELLLQELLKTHLVRFCEHIGPGGGRIAGLQAVSFQNDHFVKASYAEELYALMSSKCCTAKAPKTLEWQEGGHAVAFLRKARLQTGAIQAIFTSFAHVQRGSEHDSLL